MGKQSVVLPVSAPPRTIGPRVGRCHALLTSESIQSSLQLGAGLFVACLFTYVLPISFPPMSCTVATWLCVVAVMASPANHLGVRVTSASGVTGSTMVGAMLAAVVATFSHLAGPLYSPQNTAVLGILVPATLAVLAPARVAASPPLLWAQGMNACLAFGLTALTTYTLEGIGRVWYTAGTLVLANTIAAVVVVLVAAIIVPTHATEEVQSSLADNLLHCGVATSRYAGRLFRPQKDTSLLASNSSTSLFPPAANKDADTYAPLPAGAAATTVRAGPASTVSDGATQSSAFAPTSSSGWSDSGVNQATTNTLPNKSSSNNAAKAGSTEGSPAQSASASTTEAEAEAALAAADSLIEQLAAVDAADVSSGGYDALADFESESLKRKGSEPLPLVIQEAHTEEEWLELIRRTSAVKLSAPDASSHPQPTPPIATLRPRLAKAQTLFMSAAGMEPQWLRGGWRTVVGRQGCYWFDIGAWSKAAGCLQLLLTRLSALEAVIEDGQSLHITHNPNINPRLLDHISLVYSKAASSLAHMSQTVRAYGNDTSDIISIGSSGSSSRRPALKDFSFSGKSVQQEEGPEQQQQQQAAVNAVCGRAHDSQLCWQKIKAELAARMQEECEGHWTDVMRAGADSPVVLPSLTVIRHIMFTWSLTNAIVDSLNDLEQAVTAAVCAIPSKQGCAGLPQRLFGWVLPTLPMLTGRNLFVYWYNMLCHDLPQQLKQGMSGVRSMLASPVTQAAFKYWLVLVIVFEVTLVVMYAEPVIRPLNPAFGFVAASLTMSEKVEATVSKFVFWVFGTILGGVLGFLAMWHPALASNPFGLVAVCVAAALVVGLLGVTKARVGITLVLMTLSTLILCQCCGHAGSWAVSVARVASVLFGVTTAVLVSNAVLPWYTSAWSIQTMKSTFISAVELVNRMHAQFYADGAAAVATFNKQCVVGKVSAVYVDDGVQAAAAAAAEVAAAAGDASAAIACKGPATCPVNVTPAVLQALIARPLVAVQTSLLMDTVAWQRGVLATPPVVPALLRAMFGMLDRLAGLQLALQPPSITNSYTGSTVVNYGVPMTGKICEMLHLCSQLAAAVVEVLEDPSCHNSKVVQERNAALQAHRVTMYSQMQHLRQQLHLDVHRQHRRLQQLLQEQQVLRQRGQDTQLDAQICPVKRQMAVVLGGVDDTVRYLGFQFASIKALNMIAAVADVACKDACRTRNSAMCTVK